MSHFDPIILGEVLFDTFPGGKRVLGGAPFNVCWHLRGLGLDPLFLSAVGADEPGDAILARMRSHGLRTEGVQRLEGAETGRVDVLHAETAPEYHFPAVSAWDCFSVDPSVLPAALPLLYQGSLFLRSEGARTAAAELARRAPGRRFVDVNLRAPWFDAGTIRTLAEGALCLKASDEELGQLCGWFDRPASGDLVRDAHTLQEAAALRHVFVTRGPEGAFWLSPDGAECALPAAPVGRFVDSVGAGDASAAVALLGLLRDWPTPVTLERAMRFAARICGIPGAIPTDPDFYHDEREHWI